jgi:hypothetical protein
LDERWIHDQKGVTFFELAHLGEKQSKHRKKSREVKGNDTEMDVRTEPEKSEESKPKNPETADGVTSVLANGRPNTVRRSIQDGPWKITIPDDLPLLVTSVVKGKTQETILQSTPSTKRTEILQPQTDKTLTEEEGGPPNVKPLKRQPTVEDALEDAAGANVAPKDGPTDLISNSDILDQTGADFTQKDGPSDLPVSTSDIPDRIQTARIRQAARRVKLEEIERDKSLVQESVKRGAINSPYQPARLLLTQHPHNEDQEPTEQEEAARKREEERVRLRR